MADCYIMMEQIEIMFGLKYCDIKAVVDKKIARLEKRLAEGVKDDKD
jgi:translation elongation factor EF-1beta